MSKLDIYKVLQVRENVRTCQHKKAVDDYYETGREAHPYVEMIAKIWGKCRCNALAHCNSLTNLHLSMECPICYYIIRNRPTE